MPAAAKSTARCTTTPASVLPEMVAKLALWLDSLPGGVAEFLSYDLSLDLTGTRFAAARGERTARTGVGHRIYRGRAAGLWRGERR